MLNRGLSVLINELNKAPYFFRAHMMVLFISLHRSFVLPVVLYTVSAQGVSLLSLKNTVFLLVDFIARIGWIICYLTETPSFTFGSSCLG